MLNNSLNTDVAKPFMRSKTGNYLGYSEENPWKPPGENYTTVAACLDKYYWLNHYTGDIVSSILQLDIGYLLAFAFRYSLRPE